MDGADILARLEARSRQDGECFVLFIVGSLAWPAVVVTAALLFRKEINSALKGERRDR